MSESDNQRLLSRRDVFIGGATAAGMALATGTAAAEGQKHADHAAHAGHGGHGGHAGHGKHAALIDAAANCVKTGEACLAHCIHLLGKGDSAIKDCAEAVSAMLPVSQTLLRLASMDAKRLKFFAVVATDFMRDCRTQCKRQAPEHAECKACLQACDVALAEMRKLIA